MCVVYYLNVPLATWSARLELPSRDDVYGPNVSQVARLQGNFKPIETLIILRRRPLPFLFFLTIQIAPLHSINACLNVDERHNLFMENITAFIVHLVLDANFGPCIKVQHQPRRAPPNSYFIWHWTLALDVNYEVQNHSIMPTEVGRYWANNLSVHPKNPDTQDFVQKVQECRKLASGWTTVACQLVMVMSSKTVKYLYERFTGYSI